MKRNRFLMFLSALGVLVGLGVVVVLMFQDSSTPKGPAIGPARTDAPAPAKPAVETPQAPIGVKPGEGQTIKPRSVTEPQAYAQDAGLGGVVQNEQGVRIADATCDLFEDTAAIKDRTQEGELREKQVTNSEGYFLFDRFSLSLGERYVLKVAHKDYMTERKPVDLKKDGNVIYVTLKTGTAINGTVRTAAGQPIAGATVTVYDMNQGALDPNGSVETFVMADVTGQYNVAHVCAGMKKIQASAAGYATADRQAVQVEQGKALSGIDFALNEGGGISGHVTASDGGPIAGAFVVARPIRIGPRESPNQPPPEARDIQARREADARSRDVSRAGVQGGDGGMQEKEAAEAEELARQGRDEASAKLANIKQAQITEATAAQIKAEKMEREAAAMKGASPGAPGKKAFAAPQQPGAMTTISVRTNPDGTFNIAGTEIGTYQVSVTGTGYIPPPQQTVESPSGGLQFMLQPNARIIGRVVDDETKKPVIAFTIGVTNSPDEVLIPVHTKKPFGPPRFKDGNFEYVDVKPGRYWLVADAPGYAGGRSEEIVMQQGERREGIVINLVRGATIKGRVLDAKGGPVANATVQPDPASLTSNGAASIFLSVMMQNMRRDIREAKTDAEGNFSIPNMLSGSYTLTVRHPEYGPQTTASFVVPGSGDVSQPDILMSRGATIKGRVKMPDGSPDAKAMVQIAPVGGTPNFSGHRSAYTDADGRFEVNGLALGQYRVVVAQRNGQPDLGTLFTTLKNPNVFTLSEGEVKEMDL